MNQSAFTIEPDLRELRPIIRKYSDEEKQQMANEAADLNNKVRDIEEQKKDAMKDFNEQIKMLKAERDEKTLRRQRGFDQTTEMCEGHLEERNGQWFMVFYSSLGIEVDSRHATPSERQTRIKEASSSLSEGRREAANG